MSKTHPTSDPKPIIFDRENNECDFVVEEGTIERLRLTELANVNIAGKSLVGVVNFPTHHLPLVDGDCDKDVTDVTDNCATRDYHVDDYKQKSWKRKKTFDGQPIFRVKRFIFRQKSKCRSHAFFQFHVEKLKYQIKLEHDLFFNCGKFKSSDI